MRVPSEATKTLALDGVQVGEPRFLRLSLCVWRAVTGAAILISGCRARSSCADRTTTSRRPRAKRSRSSTLRASCRRTCPTRRTSSSSAASSRRSVRVALFARAILAQLEYVCARDVSTTRRRSRCARIADDDRPAEIVQSCQSNQLF